MNGNIAEGEIYIEHQCRDVRDKKTELLDRIIGKNVTFGACSIITGFGNNTQSRSCSSGYVYAESADVSVVSEGVVTISVTLTLEVFPSQHRKLVGCIGNLVWGAAVMTIPIWAYFLQNSSWRVLQMAYTSVSLYALAQYWLVEESIPWSVANDKTQQVMRVLKKAARISRVHLHDVMEPLHLLQDENEEKEDNTKQSQVHTEDQLIAKDSNCLETSCPAVIEFQTKDEYDGSHDDLHHEIARVKRYTFFDMLTNKRLLLYMCILWFTWLTNALTYFSLFLTSSSLAGDRFLNFFLNAAVELPAYIICFIIIDRIGRKKTCMVFHGIAGVALIIATIVRSTDGSNVNEISTLFSLIGKFGISGSFGTICLYTPEIFPTNLRNVGLGTCSAFARIGGMLSPFSNLLAGYAFWAPGTIFGVCCLLVTALMMFLPETTGRELPQTIEDLTSWDKPSESMTYISADDDSMKDVPHGGDNMILVAR